MNYQNYVHPTSTFIAFDNPKERWRSVKGIMQDRYFISSEGRVMKLTSNGIFKKCKTTMMDKYLRVGMNIKGGREMTTVSVSRLIMQNFVGGDNKYNTRRIGYKNKNPRHCTYKNLYWKNGFDTVVDFEYLSRLKPRTLDSDDTLVVKFLFSSKIEILYNLVEKYSSRISQAIHKKNMKYNVKENASSIVLRVHDEILAGKYKPVSTYCRYERQTFRRYLTNVSLNMASKETGKVRTPEGISEDQFYSWLDTVKKVV